jgi:hypothetical protein
MRERAFRDISRPKQRITAEKDCWRSKIHGTIRPDSMIICSDWPTILEYSTTFEYIKDDGSRDEIKCNTECVWEQSNSSNNKSESSRVIVELWTAKHVS